MTALALGLVLAAALVHATWNLLAKQADDTLPFLWCAALATGVLYFPLGLWLLLTRPVPAVGWGFVLASSMLEAAYFWTLSQAYRHGDLSLVYPVVRGVGPLLVPLAGVLLLGEQLSVLAALGIALIVAGVVAVHLPAFGLAGLRALSAAPRHPGTRYALLAGLCVAAYSILDKRGVAYVHPLLYAYCLVVGAALGLLPLLLPRRQAVAREWRRRPWPVVGVGLLSPLGYGLVLLALTFSPVSYIAPAREVSVVLAAFMGSRILREPAGPQRLFGATLVAAGLVLLVLG